MGHGNLSHPSPLAPFCMENKWHDPRLDNSVRFGWLKTLTKNIQSHSKPSTLQVPSGNSLYSQGAKVPMANHQRWRLVACRSSPMAAEGKCSGTAWSISYGLYLSPPPPPMVYMIVSIEFVISIYSVLSIIVTSLLFTVFLLSLFCVRKVRRCKIHEYALCDYSMWPVWPIKKIIRYIQK